MSQQKTGPLIFTHWILSGGGNKRFLYFLGTLILLAFILFKVLYPYPGFTPDSGYYIEMASGSNWVNTWSVGYAKFLRLLSCISVSHNFLVLVQFFLLQGAIVYFLFTIVYLFDLGKIIARILLILSMLNPLIFYVGNLVSPDALFAMVSLIWITQILWILYSPSARLFVWHAIVVLLAFMIQPNALHMPVLSIFVIIFSHIRARIRVVAICAIVFLLGCTFIQPRYSYRKTLGTGQYSPFVGWQLAANALYGYAHISLKDSITAPPPQFKELQALVNSHTKWVHRIPSFLRADSKPNTYYLWDENSPLKTYARIQWHDDSVAGYFKVWAKNGSLYASYGQWLMKKYPKAFLNYYILPNVINYYVPPGEFLIKYKNGVDSVQANIAKWFELDGNKVFYRLGTSQTNVVAGCLQVFLATDNLLFFIGFIALLTIGYFRNNDILKRIFIWCFISWFLSMGVSVFSCPVVLRYGLFPMIITSTFSILFIRLIIRQAYAPRTAL